MSDKVAPASDLPGTPDPHIAHATWCYHEGRVWYRRQFGNLWWRWIPADSKSKSVYELTIDHDGYLPETPARLALWVELALNP